MEGIHPVATGAASDTVAAHRDPQELVFYAGWFCPFAQRAWIALEEKQIPYQYQETNPYKKDPEFLAINPKGLVPAVTYKGRALYESLVLSEFFDDAFPSSGTKLLPSDPIERAYARIWIDYIPFTDEIKGPFFLGDQFSLVDVVIGPWIARDYVLREHRNYSRKDVGPKYEQYAALVENRPSILNTMSEKEHLDLIYGRYLRDEAQSQAAKAARAGRPIP
ncbi:glutathione S-transferase [Coprinopsis sp. MPI-PUGE-AT-0042]|nr:glutathione S-transferase [Coprinopsis sp. MPI-PUGE-AT-0042]